MDGEGKSRMEEVRRDEEMRKGTGKRKNNTRGPAIPPHQKYPQYMSPEEERLAQMFKPSPSMLQSQLSVSSQHEDGTEGKKKHVSFGKIMKKSRAPEIIEFMQTSSFASMVPVDEPLFQPFPMHMQFREYSEFGVYTQTLYFRNNDSVPRRMRIAPVDSQHFSIHPNPRSSDRVAPGMEVSYEVTFRPHEKKDYHQKLVCITDREKFIVEISALGPWACMDFPDQIGFGSCPVNFCNERTFLVRNVGEQDTRFTLKATEPFGVTPQSGYLKLGDSMQVTVTFNAPTCTEHDGEMEVCYENGQKSYVHLHGSAENINVSLDQPIAELDPAYITLTSTCTVRIHNDSDMPVTFDWKQFSCVEEEEEERNRLHQELDYLEEMEYEEIAQRYYEDDFPENDESSSNDEEEEDDELYEEVYVDKSMIAGGNGEDSDEDDGGNNSGRLRRRKVPLAKRRDIAAVKQKYKKLRRAVNEDKMLFADESFKMEPASGQVWSRSSKEITITFRPMIAADFVSIACLSISGRESRLPLKIHGRGIGPRAGFAFHIVDVGNVFINSTHTYELQLENRGDIECEYRLDESNSPIAKHIEFTPSHAVLKVEETALIKVKFCSDMLGEFSELFTFSMKGSNDKLKVRLKGCVIGPTFHLNIQELKFDRVAYGFCNKRSFNIYNTSAIPMEFALRVPGDGKFEEPEFLLEPAKGRIPPGQHQAIKLEFTSRTVMKYNMSLVVDVIGIGQNILEVPIRAECAVANVNLIPSMEKEIVNTGELDDDDDLLRADAESEDEENDGVHDVDPDEEGAGHMDRSISISGRDDDIILNYGRCFIRHPYIMPLTLRNTSDVKAHFEVLPQDESTFCVATYEPSQLEGVLDPLSEVKVEITLRCAKLGQIMLPLQVRILGSDKPPLQIELVAKGRGPKVIVEPMDLDFGTVTCLKDTKKTLLLKNRSLIPAPYRSFLKASKSRFNVDCYEGCLGPGEELECEVTINANDSTLQKDELHLFVTEGENIVVSMRAKGKGTTMFCQNMHELETCQFSNVFTNRPHERKFLLENRGKREQVLTWTNITLNEKIAERNRKIVEIERMMKDKDPEIQKKAAKMRVPPEPRASFSVIPDTVALKPRMGCMFTLRGESEVAGEVLEKLVLESKVGNEKKPITVVNSQATANFINPLLHASVDMIEFCYTFNPDENINIKEGGTTNHQRRPFTLKNISKLPLNFILRAQEPFAVDTWEISLEPEEEITVTVMFDPFVNDDLKSQTILGKLVAVHQNHPQKDVFDIRAQINFPNLGFEYDEIDFGCIMNETTKTMKMKVTNTSIIDTMFSWVFVEDDNSNDDQQDASSKGKKGKSSANAMQPLKKLNPNEVFDIRPIRGMLRPGESLDVDISFFGHANRKFNVSAICEVEGGPEYEIGLKGEASQISYKLDQESIDFGDLIHDAEEERQFTITNTSKVAFGFRVISPKPEVVSCSPSEGRIFAKDSQKITVKFSPRIPDSVAENIMLEIAHFEPVPLPVFGRGIYASVSLNLPRVEETVLESINGEEEEQQQEQERDIQFIDNGVDMQKAQAWMDLVSRAEKSLFGDDLETKEPTSPTEDEVRPGSAGPSLEIHEQKEAEATMEVTEEEGPSFPAGNEETATSASYVPPSSAPARTGTRPVSPYGVGSSIRGGGSKMGNKKPKFDMKKVRVETEANRLKFVDFLKMDPHKQKETGVFALSTYVIDFGNVVIGKSRKRPFKILNTSVMPTALEIDRSALNGTSFSVEPGRVARLGEKESVDLTVTFTAKKDAALGSKQIRALVDVRNGPPIELILRAFVTMPEISISSETVSFDEVMVGQCKVIHVQFKNTSPVVADWSFIQPNPELANEKKSMNRKGKDGKNPADALRFTCTPSSGQLQPNERCNIELTFTPDDARHFQARLGFKVTNNPKTKFLTCTGLGEMYSMEVINKALEMRPTLPTESDFAESEFTLVNTSDKDIEVYSVDFDSQYLEEEKIISKLIDAGILPQDGNFRANPRSAGEPIQQSLVEMYEQLVREEEAAAAAAAKALEEEKQSEQEEEEKESPSDEQERLQQVGDLEEPAEVGQDQATGNESAGETIKASYRERGLAIDVAFVGPPGSIKAELLESISSTIGNVPVFVGLDEIVEWGAKKGMIPKEICDHYDLDYPEKDGKKAKKTEPFTSTLLTEILTKRLAEADVGNGLVFHGIRCKYLESLSETFSAVNASYATNINSKLRIVLLDWSKDAFKGELGEEEETDVVVIDKYYDSLDAIKAILVPTKTSTVEAEEEEEEAGEGKEENDEGKDEEEKMETSKTQKSLENNEDVVYFVSEDMLMASSSEEISNLVLGWLPRPGTPLPADWDEWWIPIPGEKLFQLIQRPARRPVKPQNSEFTLHMIKPKDSTTEEEEEAEAQKVEEAAKDKKAKGGKKGAKEPEVEEEVAVVEEEEVKSRWVIPAKSELTLKVRFNSKKQGTFERQLTFEVVGGHRQYWVVAHGVCTVPTVSADPRNVFMSRIKNRPEHRLVSKKYVMSSQTYEFGPLLVGPIPSEEERNESDILKQRNRETFRISNSGILPIEEISFEVTLGSGVGPDDEANSADPALLPFIVEPETLSLETGETKDIHVWAFPQNVGEYNAKLIACIKDNPEVVQFNISCVGSSPVVAVNGPWDDIKEPLADEEVAAKPAAEDPKDKKKGGAKDTKKKETNKKQVEDENNRVVDFDRLLPGRQEERSFVLKNTCKIPVQWRMNLDQLQDVEELAVYPTEGLLNANEVANVNVTYSARVGGGEETEEEKAARLCKHEKRIEIMYLHTEKTFEEASAEEIQKVPVDLKGESYDIQVRPTFKQPSDETDPGLLEFETLRVFEQRDRIVGLTNVGKYPIKVVFNMRRKMIRSLIRIEPHETVLEPNQETEFKFTFTSQEEVRLRNNKDIQCLVMEPKTNEIVESFEVPVNAESVFSSFRVHPLKGIHFGAVKFDSTPTKAFEIKNDGSFAFSYEIVSIKELEARRQRLMEEKQHAEETGEGSEEDVPFELQYFRKSAVPNETVPNTPLELGPYKIEPQGGIIAPGAVQQVQVQFTAKNDDTSLERLRILISGSDPYNSSSADGHGECIHGIPFEIAGESHIPGINTSNHESIFEEQAVVRSLDPTNRVEGVFSTEDQKFSFGAVIHTSVPATGICERFKISNPNKIKAMVNFSIEPNTPVSAEIFSVQPEFIELPSHEYAFVSVYFKPKSMSKYSARFKASVVEGEKKPETSLLEFDLEGEGTLPCLTIVEPAQLSDNAHFVIDIGRTQLGKKKVKNIKIRNDGIVPATVKFDMPLHESFSFPMRNGSVTLGPKEAHVAAVTYCPQKEGEDSCEILLRVLHNEFELSRFVLKGTGYQEDMDFEEMPEGHDSQLCFGDITLQKVVIEKDDETDERGEGKQEEGEEAFSLVGKKTVQFSLRSNSAEPLRFEWEEPDRITFAPSIGHIAPYGVQSVSATVSSEEPVSMKEVVAKVRVVKIKYTENAFKDAKGKTIAWNNLMKIVGEESQEEEPKPEPAHENAEGATMKELFLPCNAEIDSVRYELPENASRAIQFRSTMMFQSRVFKYPVTNSGNTAMNISWFIQKKDKRVVNSHCPFSIIPPQTTIYPGSEETFTIRFAPLEVEEFSYQAIAKIKDLSHTLEPLIVDLSGEAKRPVCHFEMEASSYLENRDGPLPPSVENSTAIKVLEFQSLGVRVKNTKRFHVVNPMNLAYDFVLEPIDEETNQRFKCATTRGTILPGKRCELSFTFTPESVDAQESFWKFSIPEQNVSQIILLVGTVSEPSVELEKRHINFHSVLVGGQSVETVQLINNEPIPFSFSFDRASFVDQENDQFGDVPSEPGRVKKVLGVEPMTGTIGPHSAIPISVKFSPSVEKSHNFNLVCIVNRKPNRLSLNVKGEGSGIHDCLIAGGHNNGSGPSTLDNNSSNSLDESNLDGDASENRPGSTQTLTSGEKNSNLLDFGPVHMNDTVERTITIYNRGKFNFDFVWSPPLDYVELDSESTLNLYPLKGTVPCGESITCKFTFNPKREMVLENLRFQCTVAGARKYNVVIAGQGSKPSIEFSSYRIDFGPCFVADRGVPSQSQEQVLTVSNNETDNPVALDCLFEKNEFLDVECEPTVLQPGESTQVLIRFTPRGFTQYNASIPFEINGLYTVNVVVVGEGTVLKMELENPEQQQTVNFGSLRIGQHSSKTVRLVNRSKRAASFQLLDHMEAGVGRLEQHAITFTPGSVMTLRPRESCPITISFDPEQRYSQFTEPLMVNINGTERKLLTVIGSCQAVDAKLETSSVVFGTVCESCRFTRKVQIQNAGDLGTRFRFELDRDSRKEFSIFPMDGFLPPHSQLMVDVTFHPTQIVEEVRADARFIVDGNTNDLSVMPLALSGSCMPQPEDGIKELRFSSKVRCTQQQTITINNPSKNAWTLQPTIHNKYWQGPERLEVPAGGNASYELQYCPLTMTKPQEEGGPEIEHEGSAFFAFPNGTALLYRLYGKALAPDAEGVVEEVASSKKEITIPLRIKNWFRTAQRMNVSIERVQGTVDHFFKGPRSLDVPGNNVRDYKLHFVGYLEGKSEAKVTFTNASTGEYMFYIVKMTVGAPEVQERLTLESTVRQSAFAVITIENPFFKSKGSNSSGEEANEQVIQFQPENEKEKHNSIDPKASWWTCDSKYVRVRPLNEFTKNREGSFEVEYRPLVPTQKSETVKLTIKSPQLGVYPYELKLKAAPAQTERSLHFRTTLGSSHEQVFRLQHFSAVATDYTCKVGQPLFFDVVGSIKAQPATSWNGAELTIPIKFQPQALGEVRDVLTVRTNDGSEYMCMLYGECDPPRPLGPYMVQDPAKGTVIEFRNVFGEAKEFKFVVDNEAFSVNGARTQSIKVDASKTVSVTIKSSQTNTTGKLLVTCPYMNDLPAWVYYIKS